MAIVYYLLVVGAAVAISRTVQRLRERGATPVVLYHKPTGRIITIPKQYESEAVDQLIQDLNELPPHTGLDSAEFQVL